MNVVKAATTNIRKLDLLQLDRDTYKIVQHILWSNCNPFKSWQLKSDFK